MQSVAVPVAKPLSEKYARNNTSNSSDPHNCSDLLFFVDGIPEHRFRHPNDLRPRDYELKGVRYGDTGLSATGDCFREKICRRRTTGVRSRYRIIPQAIDSELDLGIGRHADRGGGCDGGVAVPGDDAARRDDAARFTALDPFGP